MREESAIIEVDGRGRVQLPQALRRVLKIEPGTMVRVKVSVVDDGEKEQA